MKKIIFLMIPLIFAMGIWIILPSNDPIKQDTIKTLKTENNSKGYETKESQTTNNSIQSEQQKSPIALSEPTDSDVAPPDQLERIRQNEEQLPLLETMRHYYSSFSDAEIEQELKVVKNQLNDDQWIARANRGNLTNQESFAFQELLRRHDALHLEKAERSLEKAQKLLSETGKSR